MMYPWPPIIGGHFVKRAILTDDIFKHIFVNENFCILINISLKFVPRVQSNYIPAYVQIMAWRLPGDKPLSEPMLTRFSDAYMRP